MQLRTLASRLLASTVRLRQAWATCRAIVIKFRPMRAKAMCTIMADAMAIRFAIRWPAAI
ncbi:hypothetical protein SZ64_00175 [Erythrobacter sp. SG61-1L]|nr:hypothetical protein SZ64_00175 [Erythrobacter sp. SG61-1L]